MDNIDRSLCGELGFPSPPEKLEGALLEAVWILMRRYKYDSERAKREAAEWGKEGKKMIDDEKLANWIRAERTDEGVKALIRAIEIVRMRGSYGRKEIVAALQEEMKLRYGARQRGGKP